jgi:HK97 family phage major capsid protein
MSDPTEVKQLEEAVKVIEKKIEESIEKYEGQVKDAGSAANELRAEVKALSEKHAGLVGKEEIAKYEARIKELEQKATGMKGQHERTLSTGEQFVKSDQFKAFIDGRQNKARFETKNTIIGEAGSPQQPSDILVAPDRLSGIVPGAFRSLRVLDFLPTGTTNSNNIEYTRETTAGFSNNAAETEENPSSGKPESDLVFELANAPVRTIAHWLKLSKQVMEDAPALATYVDRRLRYGVLLRAETQVLNGNGSAPNISGILDGNFSAYVPVADQVTYIDILNAAKYQVIGADYAPSAYMLNPADWGVIERTKRGSSDDGYVAGDGAGLTYVQGGMVPILWGLPVIASNSVPEGTFICGAFDMATQIFLRQGVAVEMFEQDEDNVQKNLITVRAEQRMAFAVFRPESIVAGEFDATT